MYGNKEWDSKMFDDFLVLLKESKTLDLTRQKLYCDISS
jgi:hypothetical protein